MSNATVEGFVQAGQSLLVRTKDSSGNPTPIVSVATVNNEQQLTITGEPAGGTFTATFGGDTTASIAVSSVEPAGSGSWTVPVSASTSVTIGFAWSQAGGSRGSVNFEVFDGSTSGPLLGTASLGQSSAPSGLTAPGVFFPGGSVLIPFTPVGTFTTFATTTAVVRISSPNSGNLVVIDALYVNVGGTIVVYDNVSSTLIIAGKPGPATSRMRRAATTATSGPTVMSSGPAARPTRSPAGPRPCRPGSGRWATSRRRAWP